jgi:hypothetical protein
MASNVDSFFGFVDKHLKAIALVVGGLIVYKTIQSTVPTEEEKAVQADEQQRQDVNKRLIPPAPPKADADGKIDKTKEVAFNAANKAHRSAVIASELYDHMHTGKVRNLQGVNSDKILAAGYTVAIQRITLPQLEADYLALQDSSSWLFGEKTKLVDDLKFSLSSADYLKFMQRIGLSVEKAYAILHPKKTASKK